MWNKGDFEKERERMRRDMKIGKRELQQLGGGKREAGRRGRREGHGNNYGHNHTQCCSYRKLARHHTKYFICIFSLNLHQNPAKLILKFLLYQIPVSVALVVLIIGKILPKLPKGRRVTHRCPEPPRPL